MRPASSVAGATALALVFTGAALAVAAPASAATTHVTSIAPDESSYLGWHEGYANATPAFSLHWNGLFFGDGANSQILNGLVNSGEPGLSTTSAELGALIDGSEIGVTQGVVYSQVAVSTAAGWGTLRPVTPFETGPHSAQLTDLWTSSRTIGDVIADAPVELAALLASLEADGDLRYSGFGVLAESTDPGGVESITWGEDTFLFTRAVTAIPVTSTVDVTAAEIRPDESTYTGWHEGYANPTPAFGITDTGLSFGNGANSQIINGLATPLADADLAQLITSADVEVVSGEVFYQVPITFGESAIFTTLRPAFGAGPGTTTFALGDQWVSSKEIPATGTTAAIAANTPALLGDLIEAIEANGTVNVLAFGVLAQEITPSVVATVAFNGVRYNFVPVAVAPVTPAKPALAATGPETDGALGAAGALLTLGLGMMAFRAVRRRALLGDR
ncbi:hypothetical protein ESP57_15015 [Agromyces fucosus]|jgi:hypothetical protein|uniref:Choice-of-anchor A family protein n=1 Tax=Agromyces fucosus TaxID=41985 RepID=A0A4Q2JLQ2_9MICO|nr:MULTISPECIES: hypothetical protein [Agromyces]KQZ09031.1 hypothetical protein ASD23_12025 [Agromyces sp. Root1464]RXZ47834.1 hypothetical protein ESP57_15015 [Agromyces fucosus]